MSAARTALMRARPRQQAKDAGAGAEEGAGADAGEGAGDEREIVWVGGGRSRNG